MYKKKRRKKRCWKIISSKPTKSQQLLPTTIITHFKQNSNDQLKTNISLKTIFMTSRLGGIWKNSIRLPKLTKKCSTNSNQILCHHFMGNYKITMITVNKLKLPKKIKRRREKKSWSNRVKCHREWSWEKKGRGICK